MRYMIHSVPSRQWYVDKFLIPSMLTQGINKDDILVWCDVDGKGNLTACMEAFKYCGAHPADGTWHIQDDVIICHDFAERTQRVNRGVVCGAVMKEWGPDWRKSGVQETRELWYSFQCIRIPDDLAGECASWFFDDVVNRSDPKYQDRIKRRKHDDDFFRFFLLEKYRKMKINNLTPCLVDHVDYLLGGSLINKERKKDIYRVAYWEDEDLVTKLAKDLELYKKEKERA